jgi:phospholipid-binding lipoprotein MlaA
MPRRPLAAAVALLTALLGAACAQSPGGAQRTATVATASAPASDAPSPPSAASTVVARAPRRPTVDNGDPWEETNRGILDFNLTLDDCCIKPIAEAYRDNVHPWVRDRIRGAVRNWDEPRFAANSLLQGKPVEAGTHVMRFVINTTMGLGGMFDMAQIGGPPRRPTDLGVTLFTWGVDGGPYLMLPIGGPSNVRDTVAFFGDGFLNPITWFVPFWGATLRSTVDGLHLRTDNLEQIAALRAESLDFYARLRSVWRQRRAEEFGLTSPEGEGVEVLEDPEVSLPVPR